MEPAEVRLLNDIQPNSLRPAKTSFSSSVNRIFKFTRVKWFPLILLLSIILLWLSTVRGQVRWSCLPVSEWAFRSDLSCSLMLDRESLLFSELCSCSCFSLVFGSWVLTPSCNWLVYFSCCRQRQKGSRMWDNLWKQLVQMSDLWPKAQSHRVATTRKPSFNFSYLICEEQTSGMKRWLIC